MSDKEEYMIWHVSGFGIKLLDDRDIGIFSDFNFHSSQRKATMHHYWALLLDDCCTAIVETVKTLKKNILVCVY